MLPLLRCRICSVNLGLFRSVWLPSCPGEARRRALSQSFGGRAAPPRRARAMERQMHLAVGASQSVGVSEKQPSQETLGYRLPPQEIIDVIDREPQPGLSFSPDRKKV